MSAGMPGAGGRAVFLDRDGVITREVGHVRTPEALALLPGSAQAIARLNVAGWPVILYTNQSGVGRGYITAEALDHIHAGLRRQIAEAGGSITAIYACIHHPEAGCDCRKPKPGLLLQAAREHGISLTRSFAIGDSPRDIGAASAAGCTTILVLTGHTQYYSPGSFPAPQPDHVLPDLAAAVDWILAATEAP